MADKKQQTEEMQDEVLEDQKVENLGELVDEEKKELGEIEKLQEKISEAESNYRRALADYQNLQRRAQEERINWIQSANKDLLLKLLPVLDTLRLAYKHLNDKGLELSIQQFLDVLEKEGVRQIETIDKEFNPHTMECIEIVTGEEDKVIEEIRAGYMLHDKVLQSAQVKVGRK